MKNVICIDLTKYNNEKLVEVCKELGKIHNFDFNIDVVLLNKKDGFVKVYVDLTSGKCIAFTNKKDRNKIHYTDVFTEMLKAIEPTVFVKEPKAMSVDSLLEKVSKYGIDSLSVNEKNFLDNSN
jgi:hypothetical protein